MSRRPRRTPEAVRLRLEQLAPTLRLPASANAIARQLGRHPKDCGVRLALHDLAAAGVLRRGELGYQAADAPAAPARRDREPQPTFARMCQCARPLPGREHRCLKCGHSSLSQAAA